MKLVLSRSPTVESLVRQLNEIWNPNYCLRFLDEDCILDNTAEHFNARGHQDSFVLAYYFTPPIFGRAVRPPPYASPALSSPAITAPSQTTWASAGAPRRRMRSRSRSPARMSTRVDPSPRRREAAPNHRVVSEVSPKARSPATSTTVDTVLRTTTGASLPPRPVLRSPSVAKTTAPPLRPSAELSPPITDPSALDDVPFDNEPSANESLVRLENAFIRRDAHFNPEQPSIELPPASPKAISLPRHDPASSARPSRRPRFMSPAQAKFGRPRRSSSSHQTPPPRGNDDTAVDAPLWGDFFSDIEGDNNNQRHAYRERRQMIRSNELLVTQQYWNMLSNPRPTSTLVAIDAIPPGSYYVKKGVGFRQTSTATRYQPGDKTEPLDRSTFRSRIHRLMGPI